MTQLVTRTQLVQFAPFIHPLKPSLTKSIPRSQTVTLPQFSTKTSSTCLRARIPAMDAQPTGSTPPTVGGEEFIHVHDLNMESLSDSMVRIDHPSEADAVAAAAAAAPPALEASVGSDRHPVALPEELSRNVIVLSCESTAEGGVCDVYLVGTAHVSEESSREVRAIVDFLKPEAVFLELCSSRVTVLTLQNLKVPTMREIVTMLKKKHSMFEVLYGWFLAKIASKLEVFPGSEFRVAYEEAIKYGDRVILGDRPVQEMDDSDMLTLVIKK